MTLAIEGGRPVRDKLLPYGRQDVDAADLQAVAEALRSDWLTTGPRVEQFEADLAQTAGTAEAVAVSNGTAALHTALSGLGIGPGDEVIVPPITFVATANAVLHAGARPVFADVEATTMLLDPAAVARSLTPRTKAVIGVDYAGQPCQWDRLRAAVEGRGTLLIDDAAHSLGGSYQGRPVGALADASTFSFHPVKHITTGEGGAVATSDLDAARRMRTFRNHGITTDHRQRNQRGGYHYEMVELGWNYRLTDIQCALGSSQLSRLETSVRRRRALAARYAQALRGVPCVESLAVHPGAVHAWHLYVVKLDLPGLRATRQQVHAAMRAEGIGINVHYEPVHLHPYYRRNLGTGPGLCKVAETEGERLLTLPLFPTMTDQDVDDAVEALNKVLRHFAR